MKFHYTIIQGREGGLFLFHFGNTKFEITVDKSLIWLDLEWQLGEVGLGRQSVLDSYKQELLKLGNELDKTIHEKECSFEWHARNTSNLLVLQRSLKAGFPGVCQQAPILDLNIVADSAAVQGKSAGKQVGYVLSPASCPCHTERHQPFSTNLSVRHIIQCVL